VKAMAYAQLDRTLTEAQIASIVAFLKTLTGTYHGAAISRVGASPAVTP
jgi:cytochrome c peroxidase